MDTDRMQHYSLFLKIFGFQLIDARAPHAQTLILSPSIFLSLSLHPACLFFFSLRPPPLTACLKRSSAHNSLICFVLLSLLLNVSVSCYGFRLPTRSIFPIIVVKCQRVQLLVQIASKAIFLMIVVKCQPVQLLLQITYLIYFFYHCC